MQIEFKDIIWNDSTVNIVNLYIIVISPENSYQRCINGVSIKDIHVIPTALCGKMVEP